MATCDHSSELGRISYPSGERPGLRNDVLLVAPASQTGKQPLIANSERLREDDRIFRSLIVSGEKLTPRNPWASIGALIFQLSILVAVAACPRAHIGPLHKVERPALVYIQPTPATHNTPAKIREPKPRLTHSANRTAMSAALNTTQEASRSRVNTTSEVTLGAVSGVPDGAPGEMLGAPGPMPVPVVPKASERPPVKRIRVASGVAEANLIHDVPPQYPPEAGRERIEGSVVLLAVIGADGTVKDVRVESGPPLLAQAAIDAVKQWRYKPYLLNGIPVEIDSRVTINFTMSRG